MQSHSPATTVRVGVACFVVDPQGRILVGKRKSSHGKGTLQLPGGHLEMYESFEECAKREVLEETGLHIENIEYCTTTNDIFEQDKKHYVTVFMRATLVDPHSEPQLLEPDKCEYWHYTTYEQLLDMTPLFQPLTSLKLTRPHFHPAKK